MAQHTYNEPSVDHVSRVPAELMELMREGFSDDDFDCVNEAVRAAMPDASMDVQRAAGRVLDRIVPPRSLVSEQLFFALQTLFAGVFGQGKSYDELRSSEGNRDNVDFLVLSLKFVRARLRLADNPSPAISQELRSRVSRALAPILDWGSDLGPVEFADAVTSFFELAPRRLNQIARRGAVEEFFKTSEGLQCSEASFAATWGFCGLLYLHECLVQGKADEFSDEDFRAPLDLFHESAKEVHGLALIELRRLEELEAAEKMGVGPTPARLRERLRDARTASGAT